MASLPAAPAITVAQFFEITAEWRERAELIEGDIVVSPAPSLLHQFAVGAILVSLRSWIRGGPRRGQAVASPIDVRLGETTVVQPDVAWWRELDLRSASPLPPPTLAVEILSPSTRRRDLGPKRIAYGRAGVAELWFVEVEIPGEPAVTVLRSTGDGDLAVTARHGAGERVTSPLLPGFGLPVGEISGL